MSTYVRTATVLVRVNTGPPTWWKPDVGYERTGRGLVILRAGWLRACIQVGIGSKRHPEEESPECDHPGIGHEAWSYTGICPACRKCKFIGHGPLCLECATVKQ